MKLKVLTPVETVCHESVLGMVAEGEDGSFCLKPRHVDFVSALVPGLLAFIRADDGREEFLAVDRGILMKEGSDVFVSVRQAVRGAAVEELVEVVHTRFLTLDDQEKVVRTAMAKLESDFLRRFMELS
jgi:F-type H+-transporting ATPase subunit epsilon